MPLPRAFAAVTLAAVLLAARPGAAAPVEFVPAGSRLVAAADSPRALVEAARDLPAYRSAVGAIPAVREVLDSTPARRFFQSVALAEKELGGPWPELLGRVAGGGVVLAVKTGPDPAPGLLVVRGTDEHAVADAYKLLLRTVTEEAARQPGAKAAGGLRAAEYYGIPTTHGGDDFHAARVGDLIFVANREAELHAGLDLTRKPRRPAPGPAAARQLLGGDPLLWVWFDLAAAKATKAGEDFFANTRKDLFQTVVAGGTIDAVRRVDFVAAGLSRSDDGFALTVRLPAKRADLPPEFALHAPPAGQAASLPLLEPPGVVYSQSFYLDLGRLWADRKKVVNGRQLTAIEKAEKEVSRFLPGTSVGRLLEQSGAYHRVVVTGPGDRPYKTEPDQAIPPFAVVSSTRDPAFGKSVASALRAAGLLANLQLGLTMSEETHDGVSIVSYRYSEAGPYKGGVDAEKLRFNFVPCFAVVGDSLVVSSRPALVKDLIPELRKERDPGESSPAVWRARSYAPGLADLLRANPDPAVTNAVLSDGVGLDEARKQFDDLAAWVRTLGTADVSLDHRADFFEVRAGWKLK